VEAFAVCTGKPMGCDSKRSPSVSFAGEMKLKTKPAHQVALAAPHGATVPHCRVQKRQQVVAMRLPNTRRTVDAS